jgi:hypothetical protein
LRPFSPGADLLARVCIVTAGLLLIGCSVAGALYYRSGYANNQGIPREQPIPFSHEHHVAGLGLDCRYCHINVERDSFAGIPPTRLCLNCHTQIWRDAPMLDPLHVSAQTGQRIHWTRVHRLADFVYFDHSIHIAKGIGCADCHGRVDQMPLTWQSKSLQMQWCLSCHREPERFVRPHDKVFTMQENLNLSPAQRLALVKQYNIRSATDCATCHR